MLQQPGLISRVADAIERLVEALKCRLDNGGNAEQEKTLRYAIVSFCALVGATFMMTVLLLASIAIAEREMADKLWTWLKTVGSYFGKGSALIAGMSVLRSLLRRIKKLLLKAEQKVENRLVIRHPSVSKGQEFNVYLEKLLEDVQFHLEGLAPGIDVREADERLLFLRLRKVFAVAESVVEQGVIQIYLDLTDRDLGMASRKKSVGLTVSDEFEWGNLMLVISEKRDLHRFHVWVEKSCRRRR